jgi:hypothetical protein
MSKQQEKLAKIRELFDNASAAMSDFEDRLNWAEINEERMLMFAVRAEVNMRHVVQELLDWPEVDD